MFGLRAKGGINKPSYYAYGLLHLLGDERIANSDPNMLVTRRRDGTLAIALWTLGAADRAVRLTLTHLTTSAHATVRRVDDAHSNTLAVYRAMGSPQYPSEAQIAKMNAVTVVVPEVVALQGNRLDLQVPENGLVVVTIDN
jgi:xylan 1,4-beta-xylosidase